MRISDSLSQDNNCDRIMTNAIDGMGGDTPAWSPDNWETPDHIAKQMAKLIKPSDRFILEPAAGTGQIARHLPHFGDRVTHANEISHQRYLEGRKNAPQVWWMNTDFVYFDWKTKYDLIIGNPPFSLALEFIGRSLSLLNPDNPESRILFLLPGDWNASVKRGNHWRNLNAHIHHKYQIMGRVAFLKNGVAYSGRQIYDAVWDIRPGKSGAAVSYLDEV